MDAVSCVLCVYVCISSCRSVILSHAYKQTSIQARIIEKLSTIGTVGFVL